MGILYYDVVFVVDSASHLCATFPLLLKDYIEPAVQHFAGPFVNLRTPTPIENGQCQFGVVVMAAMGGATLHHVNYLQPTSDPCRLLDDLKSIRFTGGLYMKYCPMADGLAACMEYLDSFNEIREGSFHGTLQKHCIVVTNRDIYPGACEQSTKHVGKTATQLAQELGQNGVKLSIISPRQLSSLKQLFDACKSVSDVQMMSELQHNTNPGHLVLLHGFQLPGSHKKPVEPVEPVVSDTTSSQSGSTFAMAPSYSDHVSTSSSMSTTGDGLTQSGAQSVTQPNIIDDVMATISSSAQQIEVPTMSLSSGLTVAINSSVSINSNSTSITTMSSLEPFTSTAVSSQSQSANLFAIRGAGSSNILSGTGKMTPPPPASYAETVDNKGVMTSLQQPITGKVSTSLAGIQPIMNKLLTEISNSSSINPSDLTVSTNSGSSSTSSSSDAVKVELNNSVAANFGMSSGINTPMTSSLNSSGATTRAAEMITGLNTGMNTGLNTGMNTGLNTGINTGVNTGMNTGMTTGVNTGINTGGNTGMNAGGNTGMNAGMNTGVNAGMNSGIGPGLVSGVSSSSTFSGPQSRLTVSMNPTMSSSMNMPGMNHPGMSSGVNTGMNSGMNIGMGSGMNPGMGPGVNSGLGMQPMGNQIPPLPSGNLAGMQHQTPDVYTSAGVGGAAGPPMMNQSAQAQQTQVIWTGSIEVSEGLRDGAREMRSVRCSITAKVNSKLALKPELWPPKMILQLYPRSIYTSVLQQLKNRAPITTTLVTFSFLEPVASINTLKMLTSAEHQRLGMVQLLGVPQHCPVKLMILTWNNQQFVGHVPSEQDRFLMTFRQTLQELQHSAAGGGAVGGIPANLGPQLKQLLERSTPEEKKRIIEELKLRRMRQQQQQFQAQMAAGGGAMDHSIGMPQGGQPMGMMGQPNMMQPMGLQQGRPMQNQPMGMQQGGQMQNQPMGIQQAGQLQSQPMGMQQGQLQNQPMGGMPQSNPSTDPNYFLNRN